MRRGIEKMRLERAFLLEQVARRVKPNDDSSDGSPSPPPTVGKHSNSQTQSQDAVEGDRDVYFVIGKGWIYEYGQHIL